MSALRLSLKVLVVAFVVAGSFGQPPESELSDSNSNTIAFIEGRVLWRNNEEGVSFPLRKGEVVPPEARVFCRAKAKLVLQDGPRSLRFLSGATFTSKANALVLWNGALLLDQRGKQVRRVPPFRLSGPEVEVTCSGRGTLMAEVLTSGGMKIIGLTGSFQVESPGGGPSIQLRPGELRFVKPYGRGFGELVHLNLETLVSTAALIHEFPNDVTFETELAKVALEQRSLVTKRYRAQVGDSRTPETFELQPLPERVKSSNPVRP